MWPIAPLTVQSATSHGVTFHEPLMTEEIEIAQGVVEQQHIARRLVWHIFDLKDRE